MRRQDHRRGRVVHEHDDVTFHDAGRRGVGPLSVSYLGKRRPPLLLAHHRLNDALLAHRDRAHIDLCKLLPHLVEQLSVDLVFQIAEHHVRARAVRHLVTFERKLRVADTAAQQRRVGNKRFDEAVVRTAQHLARRRLLHPARGILLRVDQRALVIALDQQRHLAQKYACHRVFDVLLGVYLVECDVSVDELLHRLRVANVSERQPEAQHPLNNRVVAVTVHHPQPRPPAADIQVARDHIKAPPHAKQIIQRAGVFLVVCRKKLHNRPPPHNFPYYAHERKFYAARAADFPCAAQGTRERGPFSHVREWPPLNPPREREGSSPRSPTSTALGLKNCSACGIGCGVHGFAMNPCDS